MSHASILLASVLVVLPIASRAQPPDPEVTPAAAAAQASDAGNPAEQPKPAEPQPAEPNATVPAAEPARGTAAPASSASASDPPPAPAREQLLRDARAASQVRLQGDDAPERRSRNPSVLLPRATIALHMDALLHHDSGYDLFDEDDVAQRFGIWLGYDVARLSALASLGLELGFAAAMHDSSIWAGAIQTELETLTFSAAASLRFTWLSWLAPQLRASGGVSLLSIELAPAQGGPFEDDAPAPYGALGLGLLFHTPAGLFENRRGGFASFSIGLLVEAGYLVSAPVTLQLVGETEPRAIERARPSLGELGLSGPYLRTSIVARF